MSSNRKARISNKKLSYAGGVMLADAFRDFVDHVINDDIGFMETGREARLTFADISKYSESENLSSDQVNTLCCAIGHVVENAKLFRDGDDARRVIIDTLNYFNGNYDGLFSLVDCSGFNHREIFASNITKEKALKVIAENYKDFYLEMIPSKNLPKVGE